MLYDGGAKPVEWAVSGGGKKAALERSKIERVFAKVKGKFASFQKGSRRKADKLAQRWHAAMIFAHCDDLCNEDICRAQGKKPPADFVSVF